MLQFADMNNMERFSLAIRAQAQALEKNYGIVRVQTSNSTESLQNELS